MKAKQINVYARYVTSAGDVKYHEGHDDSDGVIQRVWAEGNIDKLHVDVGRRWRGLGFKMYYWVMKQTVSCLIILR